MIQSLSTDELKAQRFVEVKYEPANDETTAFVEAIIERIGGDLRGTSRKKWHYCVCDFLHAALYSDSGLIAWTTNGDFSNRPYSRKIMQNVQKALTTSGWQTQVQGHHRGLKAVFQVNRIRIRDDLAFKKHGKGGAVRVRDAKPEGSRKGRPTKGKLLPRSRFLGQIEPLERQMSIINGMMKSNPLTHGDGKVWDYCYRQFNNGRLDRGGRLYGGWQSLPEAERLSLTIGGRQACEIDIKSCFLFIAHQMANPCGKLPVDPYKKINFVRQLNDPDRQQQMRDFAKQLVSAILCKEEPLTKLPRGEYSNKAQTYVSVRDSYALPKNVPSAAYIKDVYDAYPFLKFNTVRGLELMFKESEIIIKSLLSLADRGIVAYPVHDCLLCAKDDEETVIKTLQGEMMKSLGAYAALEVSYSSGETRVVLGSNHDDKDPYDLPPHNQTLDKEISLVEDWPE